MPTILGKTVTAATVDRVITAFNVGRDSDDQLTGAQVQAMVRNELINRVKKIEKQQAIQAANHESDFDLV